MPLSDILLLGDPRLYEKCAPVERSELTEIPPIVDKMAALVKEFRERYGAGRAIAAPQIGYMKRLIVLNIDRPLALINPEITYKSPEMMELWDDCMSFPNLLVRLQRHRRITITYRDLDWTPHTWDLEGDLSELLQHEYDHLDGILATMRAVDETAFRWRAG